MTRFHTVPPADLELLRKFDTPTICNVVELFDLRPRTAGYMNARIQACYPKLPVHVGGVAIHVGDLLHGDRNGVTTIPNNLASAVAHACPEYMAAEAVVLDYLKAGKVEPKGYAAARNECRDRIEALAKQLRG